MRVAFFTPSGGSSAGTTVTLGGDASTTSPGDGVAVAGLAFTPVANTSYLVTGVLMVMTSVASDGARANISFPTGLDWQAGKIESVSNVTTTASNRLFGAAGVQVCASGAAPDTTNSWPVIITASFRAGASVSGDFQIMIANEVSGTTTTIKAGSFFRYEVI